MDNPTTLLDEDDLQLVQALQIRPRLSWTALAGVLDRHPTSLASRWRRLEDAGAAWTTAHPRGQPDQMSLSFHDVRCEQGRRRNVATALAAIPDVLTVEECYRDRDLMLTVITPEPAWLSEVVYPQLDRIPGLHRFESAFCTQLYASGGDWEVPALSSEQQRTLRDAAEPRPRPDAPLPDAFGPIIRELGRDGRAPAMRIAEATGLHPATARRRLRTVLDSGALSFRCEVSHRAAGYPVVCQWFARLPAEDHAAAAAALAPLGALRLCASTTGRTNFTFMMWLRTAADIVRVEQAAARQLPRLDIRESVIIANIPKRVGWILNPDGTRTGEYTAPGEAWDRPRTRPVTTGAPGGPRAGR